MAAVSQGRKREHTVETTFKAYSLEQAQKYSNFRPGYPKEFIDYILDHHKNTGGKFGAVLDLGCGPGNSTRILAEHFDSAYGLDASTSMLEVARSLGGSAKVNKIEYVNGTAEECEGIPDQSVDLVTAAMSAHWFDMYRFWLPTMARILKPGGTVALFNIWRGRVHPRTKNFEQVQATLHELEMNTLAPYINQGNRDVMTGYRDLAMPWDVDGNQTAFEQSNFFRKVWNEAGQPSEDGSYFAGEEVHPLEHIQKGISTASSVVRWREAHPDIANTDEDCVSKTFQKVRELLGEEHPKLSMVGDATMVMVKRK